MRTCLGIVYRKRKSKSTNEDKAAEKDDDDEAGVPADKKSEEFNVDELPANIVDALAEREECVRMLRCVEFVCVYGQC